MMVTILHIHRFYNHFPVEPWLANCVLNPEGNCCKTSVWLDELTDANQGNHLLNLFLFSVLTTEGRNIVFFLASYPMPVPSEQPTSPPWSTAVVSRFLTKVMFQE